MAQPQDFGFNDDAKSLKDVAHKFFQDKFTSDKLHNLVAYESDIDREVACNWDQKLWAEIVELGWLMTAVPERVDGLGMSAVSVAGLVEETGRAGFPCPLLATLSSTYILNSCESANANEALALILEGKSISFASCNEVGSWEHEDTDVIAENNTLNGSSYFVQDAKKVDYFLVKAKSSNGIALYIVPADAKGLTINANTITDLTRDQATLSFENVELAENAEVAGSDKALAALVAATPALLTILSADMCGAAEWQLQTTAEYAQVRVQFDKPIGFFQAVKHPIVDVMVEIDQARSLTYNAACAIDHEPELAEQYARMAKSKATEMANLANHVSVQVHGGIGFTWECFVHLFMKRQMHSMLMLGDATYQRAKLAEIVLAA
jgi:alkylation response protein AidB-like acyl-CoA dehydrogenase